MGIRVDIKISEFGGNGQPAFQKEKGRPKSSTLRGWAILGSRAGHCGVSFVWSDISDQ